jgi:hypothetical protein
VFQIGLFGMCDTTGESVTGKLNFIDLAGSERLSKSGATYVLSFHCLLQTKTKKMLLLNFEKQNSFLRNLFFGFHIHFTFTFRVYGNAFEGSPSNQ